MRKVIAAMNMTIDGFCDHTAGIPDEDIHRHYADLLNNGGVALYGRITYQLMEYWRTIIENPTGEQSMDDFAAAIDKIPKIVFSHTLENVTWETATLANKDIEPTIAALQQQPGKDILVCSPSLIVALTKLDLIDEYQQCIHPVIAGGGLPLFRNISERMVLKLVHTKTFSFGGMILYYQRMGNKAIPA
jgi:dihydrofolate reductase